MISQLRRLVGLRAIAAATSTAAQTTGSYAARLDALWDFGKPAVSEQRSRAELARWPDESPEAQEARRQVARSLGLKRRFDEATPLLDGVEARLDRLPAHVRVRNLLERGRTVKSSGAAQPWAVKAHATLEEHPDLAAKEAPRLAQLAAIAAGHAPATAKP